MRTRVWHILKPNQAKRVPHDLVFVDTETGRTRLPGGEYLHKLKLGWAVHAQIDNSLTPRFESWFHYSTPDEFWRWLDSRTRPKTRLWILAHNMHFDFNVLEGFIWLDKLGYKVNTLILDSQRFIIRARRSDRTLLFADTYNYVHTSVRKLGELVGLPKMTVNFDSVDEETLSVYCKRDVEIIYKWFISFLRFIRDNDLGNVGLTISQQAMNAYRHRFMHYSIYIHNHPEAIRLEREAYKGGRVEAFYIGRVPEDRVYYLDVNSLYPYVMSHNVYPTKLVEYTYNASIKQLRKALDDYLVIARVLVKCGEPVFAVKRRKLIFPVGQYWDTFTTPELQYALENCKVKAVRDMAKYEYAPIFQDYVSFFYTLKKHYKETGDSVNYQITKLFLNSLYGKFGQKRRETVLLAEGVDLPNGYQRLILPGEKRVYGAYIINGKIYALLKTTEAFNAFVAVAAHTSGYARMHLWKLMQTAGLGNVYYVDTDSLFTNEVGFNWVQDWVDDYKLGYLKLEGVYKSMLIRGAKDYTLEAEDKIKGVPRSAREYKPGVYVYPEFDKSRRLIHKGVLYGVLERETVKRLQRQYDKGVVQQDGRVTPIVLCDDCSCVSRGKKG